MAEIGTRVRVFSGDGSQDLGEGTIVGFPTVHFFRMPDGSLRSERDCEREPTMGMLKEELAKGAAYCMVEGNPKIVLLTGKVVYGCQVWWKAID